uniref:NADH-ubiquinone oxidoreductase chain 3 n=1 Tax=Geukensia demissa TaxID=27807 RepID=A0A6B9VNP4_GEUDE|nr:NADH dehydrogenase subunit 3 [Geukensia demissa]
MVMIISSGFVFILCVFFTIVCLIVSMKSKADYEKLSAYECGFDSVSHARAPFSLRFFLLGIIFVVFDVELALLIPIMNSMYFMKSIVTLVSSFIFLAILFLGLVHEYREGSLDWVF